MIKDLMIWAGLSLALVAMGASSAKAQLIPFPEFTGSFTLPVRTQWEGMTLPAGRYSLYYGAPFRGGSYAVEVVNRADGSVRGMVPIEARTNTSASKNELVLTREGNVDIVQALDLPAIGKAIHFSLPGRVKLMANVKSPKVQTQVAALHKLIQFVPVTLNQQ